MRTLFRTVIGAHIWHMEHEGSDTDVFECYQTPTIDLLRGKGGIKSFFEPKQEGNRDMARHELQAVINQLMKGNLNFVIGVMSPIVERSGPVHEELVNLFTQHPPKNVYYSTKGMVVHNVKLYYKELDNLPKKVNTILRAINFGINYLKTGEVKFEPYTGVRQQIEGKLVELDEAYRTSTLEERLPEGMVRDILLRARLKDLKESQS